MVYNYATQLPHVLSSWRLILGALAELCHLEASLASQRHSNIVHGFDGAKPFCRGDFTLVQWWTQVKADFEARKEDPAVRRQFDPREHQKAVDQRNKIAASTGAHLVAGDLEAS